MKGIYKVTCTKNNKVYIGQSINMEVRIQGHTNNYINKNLSDYNTKFYRAIRKHGLESFKFEILERIEDEYLLNEREIYWVSYYNSFQKGYNSTPGGGDVTDNCELHPNAKNSNKRVLQLKEDLLNTKISQGDLGIKYGITQSTVSLINLGHRWSNLGEYDYPIRKIEARLSGEDSPRTVLNDELVMEFRTRYQNETGREIYEDYKDLCSYTTFERALTGRTYKYLPLYKKRERKWINN